MVEIKGALKLSCNSQAHGFLLAMIVWKGTNGRTEGSSWGNMVKRQRVIGLLLSRNRNFLFFSCIVKHTGPRAFYQHWSKN